MNSRKVQSVLRSAARSAGASTSQSLRSSARPSTAAFRTLSSYTSSSRPASISKSLTEQQAASKGLRTFSKSTLARGQGESDGELSASLAEEIKYEKEEAEAVNESGSAEEPEFLANFKKEGTWKIDEKEGGDEIALTRQFGNESIRVLFSIGDLDSSAAITPGEEGDLAGAPEGEEDPDEVSFPVRCAITVSKPGKGALNIDAQAQDGEFLVEAISFYSDAKLASDLTVEADWARRGLYVGPQFETLDEKVQDQFYAYLEERGIATELALFIPELAEWKEQREYCKWLENVKAFVDA